MSDKERLLDLGTPLKFIFSHSALREGWDNPNVFQICVLREIGTERERRQTVGRGLRLAVNQSGERVRDEGVNILTVIANESYQDFADNLQKEVEEDLQIKFGVVERHGFAGIQIKAPDGTTTSLGAERSAELHAFLRDQGFLGSDDKVQDQLRTELKAGTLPLPPAFEEVRAEVEAVLKKLAGRLEIRNADEPRVLHPNRAVLDDPEFKELWRRIKARTTYELQVDSGELIRACTKAVKDMPTIPRTRVQTTVVRLEMNRGGVGIGKTETHAPTTLQERDLSLPDLLGALQDRTELTRRTLSAILRGSDRLDDFTKNPQAFIETATAAINVAKVGLMIEGIRYHKTGEEYAQSLLEEPIPTLGNILKAKKGTHDHVIYDSNTEREFAQDMERESSVKVYAKLPGWFKVPTPLGSYNPDWAVLISREGQEERLCFVAETKSTLFVEALRAKEQQKIACGKRHFEVLSAGLDGEHLEYAVVRELKDVFEELDR